MCGSPDRDLLGLRLNQTQGLRPKRACGVAVSVKKCGRCELIYPDPLPIPARISDHYGIEADGYFAEGYFEDEAGSFHIAIANELIGFAPGMTALDIGAGVGKVMKLLTRNGWDAHGIEPSGPFIEYATRRNGIPPDRIKPGTVEAAQYPPGSFNLITFGAVLEHLYSPAAAIERALGWLRPGGILHIEVPSSRYAVAKILNAYFRLRGVNYVTHLSPMHPPYHLFEFSHRSFERHGEAAGYHVVKHEYVPGIMPNRLHRALTPWMRRNGSGMQLTVWLRRG